MKPTKTVQLVRFDGATPLCGTDEILREYRLCVCLNGRELVTLLCTQSDAQALALGFLWANGLIHALSDIASAALQGSRMEIMLRPGLVPGDVALVNDNGNILPGADSAPGRMPPLKPIPVDLAQVLANSDYLLHRSELFRQTGNVHCVLLCYGTSAFCGEDLGRYNALYKAVGLALQAGVSLSECVVYTSGRIPSSMVERIICCGIPVVVSRSAPTDVALEIAKERGLAVIGFARGGRLNVYLAAPHQISLPDGTFLDMPPA